MSTGMSAARGTRGKRNTIVAATVSTSEVQQIRPPSLHPPKSGLLTIAARKIQLKAKPVSRELKPCACCRKSDPSVPMLLPVKSRKLKAKLAPRNQNQRRRVGKSLSEGA